MVIGIVSHIMLHLRVLVSEVQHPDCMLSDDTHSPPSIPCRLSGHDGDLSKMCWQVTLKYICVLQSSQVAQHASWHAETKGW